MRKSATWAYEQAIACAAHGWVETRVTEALSANCVHALRTTTQGRIALTITHRQQHPTFRCSPARAK